MEESIIFINKKINDINLKIERNIDDSIDDRGYMSQNIIKSLRDLVEYISFKVYITEYIKDYIEYNHENNGKSISYIKSVQKHKILKNFHALLEIGPSHSSYNEDGSIRLMVKYQEYLIELKKYYYDMFKETIIKNLYKFPIYNIDPSLIAYYEEIYNEINKIKFDRDESVLGNAYYIKKTKPIAIHDKVFYELTLTPATDYVNKFNRIIFYSPIKIPDNYSIKISYVRRTIKSFNSNVEINLINNYETFIKPAEINSLYKIFGITKKVSYRANEYDFFMKYLTYNKCTLNDIVFMPAHDFEVLKERTNKYNTHHILELIELLRNVILKNKTGKNTLMYLIFMLRNSVVIDQLHPESNSILSNLYLKYGCNVFETMPYASSLNGHNVSISDLIEIINPSGREYEFFGRKIKDMCTKTNRIYFTFEELGYSEEEGTKLIEDFNSKVYRTHTHRLLEKYGKNVYIRGNEESTIKIIEKLKEKSKETYDNYKDMVLVFETFDQYEFTDPLKEEISQKIYVDSKVGLIYGSAGTGKTEMIKIISKIFVDKKIAFLSKTNAALNNIKIRVMENDMENYYFSTVDSFKNNRQHFDLIVIDECSMVENLIMLNILEKCNYDCLLLVGDIYQIESIDFGNWFIFAKEFLKDCSYELTENFRTTNHGLMKLWSKVRNLEAGITEKIVDEDYSNELNESIFEERKDEEIVLCLNYDGPYGINNINRYLQIQNPNPSVEWGINTYKVEDPVIFSDSGRFSDVLYNNLKGKIVKIIKEDNKIVFQLYVEKFITDIQARLYNITIISKAEQGTIIQFEVYEKEDDDKEDEIYYIVPFAVSYATSIHKSQGLEFDSVKIIISNESEELITKNIFYTAITRAKKHLKIYWSPECQNKVIKNMAEYKLDKDVNIMKFKNNMD